MNNNNILEAISIKLYIQLLLLEKNIIKKVKIKFDENIINFLLIHYKKFYYSFSNNYIYISKNNDFSEYKINFCRENINPCKLNSNNKKKYEIVILFKHNTNNKKIKMPISLFQYNCNKNDYNNLEKFRTKIEKILIKDKYLKNIIQSISIIDKND